MTIPNKHSLAEKIARHIVNLYIEKRIFEHREQHRFFVDVKKHLNKVIQETTMKSKSVLFLQTYLMHKADKYCSQLTLIKYQFVADILIHKYIKTGSFVASQQADLWIYIYELALKRQTVEKYERRNNAAFKTYFWTCVKNFLNEKYRNDKNKYRLNDIVNVDIEEHDSYQNETTYAYSANSMAAMQNIENIPAPATSTYSSASYIRSEMIENIEALILLDGSLTIEKRKKLRLCLMLEMRLTLKKRDIYTIWNCCPKKHLKMMLDNFGKDYHHLSRSEIWQSLTIFINAYQKQDNGIDAVRIWLQRRKNVFLRLKKN
ncbi:MAG: hypothetical protein ACPG5B_17310 [Chitinophagales bacterium]